QIVPLTTLIISKDYLSPPTCSFVIHPWYIAPNVTAQLDALNQYGTKQQALGNGEGVPDQLSDTEWSMQELLLRKQINYGNSIQKPLIIHCVRAHQECLEILYEEKVGVPVIFHGFEKKTALAKQILSLGYFISLGSTILSEKKDELIQYMPLDNFFLETDDKSINIVDIYAYF